MSLRGSVGRISAAKNNADDVRLVQQLLNSALIPQPANPRAKWSMAVTLDSMPPFAPLGTDGRIGGKTIAAIVWFQRNVLGLPKPDGVIKADGITIRTLEKPPAGLN